MSEQYPAYYEKLEKEAPAKAILAGGCFWCMEPPYEKMDGVIEVISGYTGGEEVEPTYEEVAYGRTGHFEAVAVYYDPEKVSYEDIIEAYWKTIDPTQADGQFADRGAHYRTAIFYQNEDERKIAEASKKKLGESGLFKEPIVTFILPAKAFYPAEQYHQDYYQKNSAHYNRYREGSGRGPFLRDKWGK